MRAKILATLFFGALATGTAWAQPPAAPPSSPPVSGNAESDMDIRMSCEKFAEDDHIAKVELNAYMARCMQDLKADPSEQAGAPYMDDDLSGAKPVGIITHDKVPGLALPGGSPGKAVPGASGPGAAVVAPARVVSGATGRDTVVTVPIKVIPSSSGSGKVGVAPDKAASETTRSKTAAPVDATSQTTAPQKPH
ncbi:MAG: hypothetical protein HQL63_11165 [Magnetococcales bacterium]|nr:hypothetical protein [Magnetococcales bacterium]